jgi:hypothetical protein
MERTCKGGCGKAIPDDNKSGFAWGHKNGCPSELPPPSTQDAIADEEPANDQLPPRVPCDLTEAQLDRIWQSLPLPEKALGILTALEAERA